MRRGDFYPYSLVGTPVLGFSLSRLSHVRAFPAHPGDGDTMRRVIEADVSGDYPTYFNDGSKTLVMIDLLSTFPTSERDFGDIVDEWNTVGWAVHVFNCEKKRLEKWDPSNLFYYGVRQ